MTRPANSSTMTLWRNVRRHNVYFRRLQLIALENIGDEELLPEQRIRSEILQTLSSSDLREGASAAHDIAYWMTVEALRRVEWSTFVLMLIREDRLE